MYETSTLWKKVNVVTQVLEGFLSLTGKDTSPGCFGLLIWSSREIFLIVPYLSYITGRCCRWKLARLILNRCYNKYRRSWRTNLVVNHWCSTAMTWLILGERIQGQDKSASKHQLGSAGSEHFVGAFAVLGFVSKIWPCLLLLLVQSHHLHHPSASHTLAEIVDSSSIEFQKNLDSLLVKDICYERTDYFRGSRESTVIQFLYLTVTAAAESEDRSDFWNMVPQANFLNPRRLLLLRRQAVDTGQQDSPQWLMQVKRRKSVWKGGIWGLGWSWKI